MKLLKKLRAALATPDDAYATKSDTSDIEVRENQAGYIECVGCLISGHYATWLDEDMADHIRAHKKAGHRVPVDAIPNLLRN